MRAIMRERFAELEDARDAHAVVDRAVIDLVGAGHVGLHAQMVPMRGIQNEVARMFPQLEILAFIGKGGMGAVYKARQPGLDRFVALKILPPETVSGSAFVDRFNREARALAKLSHPNIVTVHEFGQVNGLPFFLMEFVDGLNLRQLEQSGKLSPRQAMQMHRHPAISDRVDRPGFR